jgi:membrane-bound lytic murein transglycosylase D
MRNSIAGYGIRIDEWRDDRRDFMKSTDAALRKLKYNFEVLGDWRLAVAAYNCGLTAMNNAMRKAGSSDYWELCRVGALPPETRAYLPKFMAVAVLAGYGGRYGLDLGWPEPRIWESLPLERSVDLAMLAEKVGLDLELLRSGNAELRYNVTPPKGSGWFLKVPAGRAEEVRAVLSDPSAKLLRYYMYTVKSGDTLSALARHYGISVDMILSHNPGLRPEALRIGSSLIIPAMKDVSPYEGRKLADSSTPFNGRHQVAKGETLWSISLRYGVSPELLAERNGLELNSILREGSALKVPINE